MIRRLTSSPKPAARVARVHRVGVGGLDAQAVAHAVVAGEVAARLGRGDQVVGGEAVARTPAPATSTIVAPAARSASNAASSRSTHVGVGAGGQVGDPPDAQALDAVRRARRRSDGLRLRDRRRVHRVVAADDVEHERGVGARVVGERADLVEAAGERDEAVAADVAVRRLDPDDAAQRGGLADRAAGVAAERRRRRTRRPRRRRCRRSTRRGPGEVSCGLRVGAERASSRCSSPSRTRRGWSCRS